MSAFFAPSGLIPVSIRLQSATTAIRTETRKVNLEAGKVTTLDVSLKPEGGPVSGPWGRIQIKGPPHAAVSAEREEP